MLKTLLKKQLFELNKSFFQNRKTGKSRSSASAIVLIITFALMMIVLIGRLFFSMSSMLSPLIATGMSWLYFSIMGATAVLFGLFGSVFNTYSSLYEAKDNDLLLSLPIPVPIIISVRLIGVYLMGMMYSGVVIVPALIVYWATARPGAAAVIFSIVTALMLTVLVLVLSCVLGWVVAKIAAKLKNKSLITVIVSLAFLGGYYYVYFKANELINGIIANSSEIAGKIRGSAYPLYILGRACAGEILPSLALAAVILAVLALTWFTISHSFLKLATGSAKAAKTVYKEKSAKTHSADGALLRREFGRFVSSPSYMLNCSLGTLLMLVVAVFALVRGRWLVSMLAGYGLNSAYTLQALAPFLTCLLVSTNIISAPSISLEGRSLWLAQSLPVSSWQVLRAKLRLHVLLTAIPAILCSASLSIAVEASLFEAVCMILIPTAFSFICAAIGLIINLKLPNLNWTTESAAVKQSFGVILSMFACWACIAVPISVYALTVAFLSSTSGLAVCAAVTVILVFIAYAGVRRRGVKIFERL